MKADPRSWKEGQLSKNLYPCSLQGRAGQQLIAVSLLYVSTRDQRQFIGANTSF